MHKRTAHLLGFVGALALLAGCTPTSPFTPGADGGPAGPGTGSPGSGSPGTGSPGTGTPGTGGPGTGSPGVVMPTEICGNGIDDDNNRQVDENCRCTVGQMQACWVGQAVHRGIGECRDGHQTCQDRGGGQSGWGPCEGLVQPVVEVAGDGKDQDCNGADRPAGCTPGEIPTETCGNGIDDDCNGLTDDRDWQSSCNSCSNFTGGFTIGRACKGRDFQCGEAPNCMDTACRGGTEVNCFNGFDDDCDGVIDCMDQDCVAVGACTGGPGGSPGTGTPGTGTPGSGTPDSGAPGGGPSTGGPTPGTDGGTPGTDSGTPPGPGSGPGSSGPPSQDAFGLCECVPSTSRWCDTPTGCLWGKQRCAPDGRWGACQEVDERPSAACNDDYYYNLGCCLLSGACCQNYPFFTNGSIGNCTGAINCDGTR